MKWILGLVNVATLADYAEIPSPLAQWNEGLMKIIIKVFFNFFYYRSHQIRPNRSRPNTHGDSTGRASIQQARNGQAHRGGAPGEQGDCQVGGPRVELGGEGQSRRGGGGANTD